MDKKEYVSFGDTGGLFMKPKTLFLAVKIKNSTHATLTVGENIFDRPMPWTVWFKAIFPHKRNPWRFVRVIELGKPLKEYGLSLDEGELVVEFEDGSDLRFRLERPTLLHVIEWAIQSIYYGTSLKFWRWPVVQKIIRYFREF